MLVDTNHLYVGKILLFKMLYTLWYTFEAVILSSHVTHYDSG